MDEKSLSHMSWNCKYHMIFMCTHLRILQKYFMI